MFSAHSLYEEDLAFAAGVSLDWEKLRNTSVLISGASGLIGTFIVDVLMYKNFHDGLNCRIYALGRNIRKAQERFRDYLDNEHFKFIPHDINISLQNFVDNADYIMHLASNTHPRDYAADPTGTILTNIIGLNNLLDFGIKHSTKRFLFTSSVEIYGQNRGDTEYFDEDYCGYIDISKARSGYPEAKRCGETLCQSYIKQYGLDSVIARLPRTYGPTMTPDDSKAAAQFIRKAASGENIVLKSAGTQFYSYGYVADAVTGLFTILTAGVTGTAYNIADEGSDITLKELAEIAAKHVGTKVVFEIADNVEKEGYSLVTKACLNPSRLQALGWKAHYTINEGITRTIDILSR